MADNRNTSDEYVLLNNTLLQPELPKVYVEPCQTEFFYEKFKQSYPMYKNPRGLCLIINIYQIDGMPPRRWSNRDSEALKQLFDQLLFTVKLYTDNTHDLTSHNFMSIIREFAQMPEHQEAQCCVICLMSHGEEGYLTTKEGDKVLLDEIFTLFNNLNCPNLAGKPKLFFIQSCRDDPISGPAEDLGIRLSYNLLESSVNKEKTTSDETDGACEPSRQLESSNSQLKQIFYHIPTLCDMLVGFPTQKGFIAYRKPEIGSWYMNAIVQVFSKHSCDTDICAMLNMVNSMISNEVTNTGKKQMSEYTSKLTKPYFYFFPGLASESAVEEPTDRISEKEKEVDRFFEKPTKRQRVNTLSDSEYEIVENLISQHGNFLFNESNHNKKPSLRSDDLAKYGYFLTEQTDSNSIAHQPHNRLTNEHIEFVANKARIYWKPIAREIKLFNECQLLEIEKSDKFSNPYLKLSFILRAWVQRQQQNSQNNEYFKLDNLIQLLAACRLNKVKDELISQCA